MSNIFCGKGEIWRAPRPVNRKRSADRSSSPTGVRQKIEFLLIERPEILELCLEGRVSGQQIGADGADRHGHAAAHVGKADQQALARSVEARLLPR